MAAAPAAAPAITGTGISPAAEGAVRVLSMAELEYVHTRFFGGRESVTTEQFGAFWAWFGKLLVRLRSMRQVASLWRQGLLWAFSSRRDIEAALLRHPRGTFVLRLSERHPGHFAVAYRDTAPAVRHYLIRTEDIGPQKTLPDFIAEARDLTTILRVIHNDCGETPLPPLLVPVDKNVALARLYTPREALPCTGYETTIRTTATSAGIAPVPIPASGPVSGPLPASASFGFTQGPF